MKIHQFIDQGLAHFSYAVVSDGEMAVIDPARDPRPYYEYAEKEQAWITAVFETHPHADFVSSHTEIAKATGAAIYESRLVHAAYDYTGFDDGDSVQIGKVMLRAFNTPGHSPDSICITVEKDGLIKAVFTGDTLMIGDVGRPDLREDGRDIQSDRRVLARAMYYSIHDFLLRLPPEVKVYPAHGGGSLCSRSQASGTFSTIGQEMLTNPSLKKMDESEFVEYLLKDQPFVPKYFRKDVGLNKNGAPGFEKAIRQVPFIESLSAIPSHSLLIDTRRKNDYDRGHLAGSFNLADSAKFETWLGSIVGPNEPFYLIAGSPQAARAIIEKAAKIGYETLIRGVWTGDVPGHTVSPALSLENLQEHPDRYTIVDVRNPNEAQEVKIFDDSLLFPLPELRERWQEIPHTRPILVHCAAGYRSAAASSILRSHISDVPVFDLGEKVALFTGKK